MKLSNLEIHGRGGLTWLCLPLVLVMLLTASVFFDLTTTNQTIAESLHSAVNTKYLIVVAIVWFMAGPLYLRTKRKR